MADAPENLVEQLDLAGPIITAHGWLTPERWIEADLAIRTAPPPTPAAGRSLLAAALLERKLLTREQTLDLDALMLSQRLFTDFRLERKLGSGGMGTVFLARHLATKQAVALKTMNARLADDQGFVERFHREARALQGIDHASVAKIIATGEEDGHCWLAMEYIQGPSLMSLLKKHKVLPEAWCLQVVRQVATGLGYVWSSAGLVHRDLKPENILVTSDDLTQPPVAKLIDFGLVKSNQEDDRLTQTGMTIGTPLYMSPEQVRGEKLDIRSDIYGLGATLFHLLTGSTPFNGSSPGTIMSAHLTEPVPDPQARVPSLSPGTRSLVMTAMAKSVEHRFLTCEALVAACDQALAALDPVRAEGPRLLRKPLVLKTPRGERTPLANEVLPPLPMPQVEAPRRPTGSDRRPAVTEPAVPPRAMVASAVEPGPKSEAVARPAGPPGKTVPRSSPSVGPLPRTAATPPPLAGAAPAPGTERRTTTPPNSAAFRVEHDSGGGVGLLPWAVLAAAVVALLLYLLAY